MKRCISFLLIVTIFISVLPASLFVSAEAAVDDSQMLPQTISTYATKRLVPATRFSVGSGTQNDPYLITSPEEFAYFAISMDASTMNSNSYSNKYISLATDVDLSVYSNAYSVVRMCILQIFYGTFDGNGFTIKLYDDTYEIHSSHYSSTHYCPERGLFGDNRGIIRNLNIIVTSMDFSGQFNGVVAAKNSGLIENVHVVVENAITIKTPNTNITNHYYGGIAGNNDNGEIKNCSFSGLISTASSCVFNAPNVQCIGGIAGYGGEIKICSARAKGGDSVASIIKVGSVNEVPFYVGGIVGDAHIVENSCILGGISIAHDINQYGGGIAGTHISSSSYIKNCFVQAYSINGGEYIGGIVGFASGNVHNCYSAASYLTAQTGEKREGFAGIIAGACANNTKSYIVNCHAQSASISRTAWVDESGCDANDHWSDSEGKSAHEYSQTGTSGVTFSKSLIENTLGWGIFKSYSDTANNPSNVWICTNFAYLYTPALLTIRYIDESNQIFSVKTYSFDSGEKYNIVSPERYGASPDKMVVSGTFRGSEVVDVTYSHQHIPGAAATCTNPQTCTLCGGVIAEKLPHNYDAHKVTSSTCTENGYTTHTCSTCGDAYQDTITSPNGHKLDDTFKCIVCNQQFESQLRDYVIYVCDIETGNPIEGAKVTLGNGNITTDATGAAKFQLKNSEDTTLKIVATSYPEHPESLYVPNNQNVDYIYLTSDESDIYGAWCNGDNVINGDSQINAKAHALEAKIVVNGRAKANILRYELIQDTVVIATSTDGQFKVRNAYFKVGKDVTVRMYTDGTAGYNIFERKLNIKVVGYIFNFETDIKDLIPFSTGLKMMFPDGTPGFAGFEMSVPNPFLKTTNITYRHENDNIMVLFGFDHDYAKDPALEDMTKAEIFEKMIDDWASEKKLDKSREVHGSLALVIEFSEKGVTKVYGQINVGFNLEFAKGQTFMVGIIPVYGEVALSLEGELEVTKIGFDPQNARLYSEYELPLAGEINLYAGLGCHVASVGVYGQVGAELVFSSDQEGAFEKFSLWGELGVYAKLKILFFKELCYKYPLLHKGRTWPEHLAASRMMLYSINAYNTDTREYLKDRTEWLNVSLMSNDSDSYVFLQDSTYTAIEPKVVTCGDTIMMIFLDDDGSESLNYQHLYYSLYDKASGGWGEPQKLDANNRSDVEFDVYADGTTIYVAYTELDSIAEEDQDDYAKILGTAEVVVAQYDFNEGQFVNHTNLSANDTFDTLPRISSAVDGITVAWVNNFTNDIFSQNANNVVFFSALAGEKWSVAESITDRGATVVSMDVGSIDGKSYVATIRDVDCDLSTIEDRVLYLIDLDGNITQIVNEENTNDNVQFVEMNGEKELIWYNNQNLYHINSANDAPAPMFAFNVDGFTSNYKFIQIAADSYAILFAQNEQTDDGQGNILNGSNIYGIFYNNGNWGNPVPITQNESGYYVDAYDACMYNGKMVIPYINAETTITEEDIVKKTSFLSTTFELRNDIVAGNAEYRPSNLFNGTTIALQIPVTNNSWQKLTGVSYAVKDSHGNDIYVGNWEQEIDSGATEYLTITLSKNLLSPGENYSICISTTLWTETDASNNTSELLLWYTDFSVIASQTILAGTQEIQYSITNDGNIGGKATLKVYKLADDGKEIIIIEKEISNLDIGETINGSLTVTQDYYSDNTDSGTVILTVVSENDELYRFNDSISLTVGDIEHNATTEVNNSATIIASPIIANPYIRYDQVSGNGISVSVDEKGWSFVGVNELSTQNYSYSHGVFSINRDYLLTLGKGYHTYTLSYSNSGKTTDVLLIVEIIDSGYESVVIIAEDQVLKYDGYVLELGADIVYSTKSQGSISSAYSADNGATWNIGLPKEIGEYLVRLTVAQDDANKYFSSSHTISVTIEKGTRAISVPIITGTSNMQVLFGSSIPTAGKTDGTILYGYSLTNDVSTVTEWTDTGILPKAQTHTTYYVFAKIVNGEKYDDAYSLGYALDAHIHEYVSTVTPPTTQNEGYTLHTCIGCGDEYKDNFVDKLDFIYGDCNGDGFVTTVDLSMLRKHFANKDPLTGVSTITVQAGADCNGDGFVTTVDLSMLRKYFANKDPITGESSLVLGPR